MEGKNGEYRSAGTKSTDGKISNKKGRFRDYEYIMLRLGYAQPRQGEAFTQDVRNVCILYWYKGARRLTSAERVGSREFVVGDWFCQFGEVVEWCGLFDLTHRDVGRQAGITSQMVDMFIRA